MRVEDHQQHRHHDAVLAHRIGEEHGLLALGRHVHGGGEVVLARLQGGDARLEVHVADLDVVATRTAEAHGHVDVVAHVLAFLDVGEGLVGRGRDHVDGAVLAGEAAHVHDLLALVGAKPRGVDLGVGAVGLDLAQKLVELVAELLLAWVVLAEGEGVVVVGEALIYVVDLRLLGMDALEGGLVAQEGIDAAIVQGRAQAWVAVKVEVLAVWEVLEAFSLEVGTGGDADLLAVVVLVGDLAGWAGHLPAAPAHCRS